MGMTLGSDHDKSR